MWQLIRNAQIYTPEPSEAHDLLIVGEQVAAIGNNLSLPPYVEGQVFDLQGQWIVPGFIDAHVHICGGGGEAGPNSRTPEIQLSQLTQAGITTVVGCLGTDAISRSMEELLVKARALEEEGLTTFVYSGAYQADCTLLANLRMDLVLIDKVIGAGEIAISDHRSAQPQLADLERLAAETRVGGMLGGKAGVVHLHLGEGKRGIEPIRQIVEETEIPIIQFMPTHMNRTYSLLEQGLELLKAGGNIDLTAGCDDFPEELQVPHVLYLLSERKLLNDRVTVTSDGNGSMPQYNDHGELVGMGIGSVRVLWRDIREAVQRYNLSLEVALRAITSNPALVLKLPRKGLIRPGFDADLVVLDPNLEIQHVWARGKLMVQNNNPIVFGRYEKALSENYQNLKITESIQG
ncbi:beta-aspartyl-peptidase [Desulfitobacterium metallireducens]|uniref:Isoaspartyl dipeptidase n=1 Tax=Desulfitobacterium metallireducens DSM 15288 TaxID=871968 RepID=W0EC53_9FIRM|nr:beta-aspartyl-peptidase [Desulfitobacterium metallireducens]AHF06774.1 peptidase [Desulfitobacterium metallireducens DSM 15288]